MGKKKVNPRRKPATEADVRRAKDKATEDAIRTVLYMLLYVLIDKRGATKEEIHTIQEDLNYIADSMNRGYVDWRDIKRTLEEEYDVELRLV